MESTSIPLKNKDQRVENLEQLAIENKESTEENSVSEGFTTTLEPEQALSLSIWTPRTGASCSQKLCLQNFCDLNNKIPKHIISLDENYVLHCLELIHKCGMSAAQGSFTSRINFLSDSCNSSTEINNRSSNDMGGLVIEYPLASGIENALMGLSGDGIIGTVTGSQSMINILKSPLLHRFGTIGSDACFGKKSFADLSEPINSGLVKAAGRLSGISSCNIQKEAMLLDHGYEHVPVHKRIVSVSSTNSTFSDQSSSCASASSFQGMLQCTWKDGLVHHVFSVDDKREIYVANLCRVQSPNDKVLDYVYRFHLRKDGNKECEVQEPELELVGKMQVSSSITPCSNNSEIMETQFVLFGSYDTNMRELQTSGHDLKKNKRLTRKVVDVFRPIHSYKRRSSSTFGGSNAILEDASWHPSQDVQNSPDPCKARAENNYVPNLELAAIVVRDHICNKSREANIGGWGLKFLKKTENDAFVDTSLTSEGCPRNGGECSTSTDILVPAGFHGGPRTRAGGPSSLIERWISGGQCDCGGWDIGCPLTVLNTRASNTDASPPVDHSGECKSFDLFIQGSKQNAAIMKLVNIHDGLYYIHFQSTLSTLQSFAMAAAIIHSHSPILRSKV